MLLWPAEFALQWEETEVAPEGIPQRLVILCPTPGGYSNGPRWFAASWVMSTCGRLASSTTLAKPQERRGCLQSTAAPSGGNSVAVALTEAAA